MIEVPKSQTWNAYDYFTTVYDGNNKALPFRYDMLFFSLNSAGTTEQQHYELIYEQKIYKAKE